MSDAFSPTVSPLPGILMLERDFAALLAEDRSAESLFDYVWELGYGLEDAMRGEWAREEKHAHAAHVARNALGILFQSKPGARWKNGWCVLIESASGEIEPAFLTGEERPSISGRFESSDALFSTAFSAAQAAARKAISHIQPKPRSALLVFAARVAENHFKVRYQALDLQVADARAKDVRVDEAWRHG